MARQMCKQAQGGRRSKIIQLSSAWLHNMTIVRRNQTTLMTNRLAVSEESEGGGQSVARQMCKQAQGGRRCVIQVK